MRKTAINPEAAASVPVGRTSTGTRSLVIMNARATKVIVATAMFIIETTQSLFGRGRIVVGMSELTMRLSDAGLRRLKTNALDPHHRLPPWPTEDATPRSLEPIVMRAR